MVSRAAASTAHCLAIWRYVDADRSWGEVEGVAQQQAEGEAVPAEVTHRGGVARAPLAVGSRRGGGRRFRLTA